MAHKTAQSVARLASGMDSSRALPTPTFEEVFVRNEVVSLCLLLNRRARVMRVVDFRAGASPAKKAAVQSIARREHMEKVVALVERDECAAWARLGFQREGNIPGFYRRSDAFIMGCVVGAVVAAAGMAVVPFQAFGLREESGWRRLSVGAVSIEDVRALMPRLEAALLALHQEP